jgi:hypothetical protein
MIFPGHTRAVSVLSQQLELHDGHKLDEAKNLLRNVVELGSQRKLPLHVTHQ